MKLIQRFNRLYITYSAIVFILVGFLIFLILKSIINEETDEKILNTFKQVEMLVRKNPAELELYPFISVRFSNDSIQSQSFSDTSLIMDEESEEFRQLTINSNIKRTNYKIVIREFSVESSDLLASLTIMILLSLAGLLVLFYLISKKVSNKLWGPFFKNLESLNQFSVQSLIPYSPEKTETTEFNDMNKVLKSLTDKAITDYNSLKTFSENASHELQTPLTIIRTKIEALLQENQLSESQLGKIQSIYKAVNRLSKINSGLLLLTKIENKQFTASEQLSLNNIIKQQIENFTELTKIKELKFKYNYNSDWFVSCNKTLLEILINNLFANAILHNNKGGELVIELNNEKLIFANSGKSAIAENDKIFERFYKGSDSGTAGLGLAISKQICLYFGWQLSYEFRNQLHEFTLTMKK